MKQSERPKNGVVLVSDGESIEGGVIFPSQEHSSSAGSVESRYAMIV